MIGFVQRMCLIWDEPSVNQNRGNIIHRILQISLFIRKIIQRNTSLKLTHVDKCELTMWDCPLIEPPTYEVDQSNEKTRENYPNYEILE